MGEAKRLPTQLVRINSKVERSIQELLSYNWTREAEDFIEMYLEENKIPRTHIFIDLARIDHWIYGNKKEKPWWGTIKRICREARRDA